MKTIGITGGTGFVGRHITEVLINNGYNVVIFTRKLPVRGAEQLAYAYWNEQEGACDINAIRSLDAVIHLAGAGIADKRWTDKRKREIVESRVKGTDFLVARLKEYAPKCNTFIAASATGFYGADRAGMIPFTEAAPPCSDFLGSTCQKWEEASGKATMFARATILRFGIVLGSGGGAFSAFVKPMAFGVMPILGSGRQIVSWIEVSDLAKLILFVLQQDIPGTYNAVAPKPVTHLQLMKAIAKEKGGIKIPIPIPGTLLKAVLGEMGNEILKSCTVSSQKIIDAGFTFNFPDIKSAVKSVLG